MNTLPIPNAVEEQDGAHQIIQFWVLDGENHLSLNIGLFKPENEARLWGFMIADIAKHAVRGMIQDRPEMGDEAGVLAQIEMGFMDRLKEAPDTCGQLQGTKH